MKKYSLNGIQLHIFIMVLSIQLGACQSTSGNFKNNSKTLAATEHASQSADTPDRIIILKAHERQVQDYIRQANEAWEKEDLEQLENIYKSLDEYDKGNLRAKEGLQRVSLARNHQVLLSQAKEHIGKSESDDEIAIEKLHEILLEDSNNSEAKLLYAKLLKTQEEKLIEKSHKKLSYKSPVSMHFRDVSLKVIFEALARTTNINFILDKDVPSDQKASIYVQGMSFNDALDLLLQTNQLEKKVLSENTVIIYVNDPLRQRQYKELSVRNFTLDYADVKQVSMTLRSMLNIRDIETDPRLSSIMIKDTPEILALAEKIITSQDLPDPEVMLEMEVLEINRTLLQDLGVNAPQGIGIQSLTGLNLTVQDLKHLNGQNFTVNGPLGVNFNASVGDVNMLANPRIRIKNKDVAKIHIGEKVPVFTANISSTGVSSETVQYIDAGLKLEVIPTISASGDVTIKVDLNVGSIGSLITNGQSSAFRVGTRTASTQLRLHDGETEILAGLINDQDTKNINKIPGIGDIPLLGRLFSDHSDNKSKTEIVLSITPHIIREKRTEKSNQTEYWIGSEDQTGKRSPSPNFNAGGVPFMVPKPPPQPSAASTKDEKPESLNVPLPAGFSLGGGLNPKNGE